MYVPLEGDTSKVQFEVNFWNIQSMAHIHKIFIYRSKTELSLLSLKNVNKHGHQ